MIFLVKRSPQILTSKVGPRAEMVNAALWNGPCLYERKLHTTWALSYLPNQPDIDPVLVSCWASVADGINPTFGLHLMVAALTHVLRCSHGPGESLRGRPPLAQVLSCTVDSSIDQSSPIRGKQWSKKSFVTGNVWHIYG